MKYIYVLALWYLSSEKPSGEEVIHGWFKSARKAEKRVSHAYIEDGGYDSIWAVITKVPSGIGGFMSNDETTVFRRDTDLKRWEKWDESAFSTARTGSSKKYEKPAGGLLSVLGAALRQELQTAAEKRHKERKPDVDFGAMYGEPMTSKTEAQSKFNLGEKPPARYCTHVVTVVPTLPFTDKVFQLNENEPVGPFLYRESSDTKGDRIALYGYWDNSHVLAVSEYFNANKFASTGKQIYIKAKEGEYFVELDQMKTDPEPESGMTKISLWGNLRWSEGATFPGKAWGDLKAKADILKQEKNEDPAKVEDKGQWCHITPKLNLIGSLLYVRFAEKGEDPCSVKLTGAAYSPGVRENVDTFMRINRTHVVFARLNDRMCFDFYPQIVTWVNHEFTIHGIIIAPTSQEARDARFPYILHPGFLKAIYEDKYVKQTEEPSTEPCQEGGETQRSQEGKESQDAAAGNVQRSTEHV